MSHYFYITPEEYEEADRNGVSARLLERRVRYEGWSKDRAIHTPPRKFKDRSKWVEIAKKNGISRHVFDNRIRYGWSEEQAATEPVLTLEQRKRKMRVQNPGRRKYPRELIKQAEQNGINYKLFLKRVSDGWSWERASLEPPISNAEKGHRGSRTLRQRYGDVNGLIFQKRQ